MQQHQRARILSAVLKSHPELVKGIQGNMVSDFSNTSLVPAMYKHYLDNYPSGTDPDSIARAKLVILAAILHLYDKLALYHGCVVTGGLCKILSIEMGYKNDHQSVSSLFSQTKSYIKNPSFRADVERVCSDIRSRFTDTPVDGEGKVRQFNLFDNG